MKVDIISKGTQEFLFSQIDNISTNNFKASLIRPFIKTAIENNFYKAEKLLNSIADKNGNINIEKLIDDIISSILNGKSGTLNIDPLGTIDFGNDAIQINVSFLNTYYKFTSQDFISLKNKLIEKYGN